MMNVTPEQARARTSVFWDIKTYPVPRGCDAGVVGRCLNRYLLKLGYSGPLSIFAVGLLTDVPDDVLRVLSSTGIITLNHVPLGSIGILRSMNECKATFPPPYNMMLISTDESILPRIRHSCGYNIFRLFPDKSHWIKFLLEDPGENKCSVTPKPGFWICSVCTDQGGHGYENFTTHLSSRELKREAARVDKQAVGLTSVIWDITGCPVPPDCDALRVRPCIKQYLKDFGYSGPLTINAIGRLTDVNQDVMRAVSSTGVILEHVPFESNKILTAMYCPELLDPHSANIMVICPYLGEVSAKAFGDLKSHGYNIIELFPYNSPYSESLWKTFLLEGTLEEKEDKCSEMGEHASWVCAECHLLSGNGFDNFITHLSSRGHEPKPIEMATDATVFWDIKGCPVPPGCDARRVGLWIKQYLSYFDISGPFTLNAIGLLTDFPTEVLQALSSTGIVLKHSPFDSTDIMYQWASLNPPPANMMVISPSSETLAKVIDDLEKLGYIIIVPLQNDSCCSESLWEKFLLRMHDSATLVEEEDKCSETDASWVCSVCHGISGKGFENFITHLSQKHGQKRDEKDEEAVEDGDASLLDSLPVNDTSMVSEEATKEM